MNPNIRDTIKQAIESNISTASAIISEIIKTIYDMSSNANDLAKIIERDPPLGAKILGVANSAYYGSMNKITSIKKAVVFLGFENIKEIVLSVSLTHYFSNAGDENKIDFPGLWMHSGATAKASQLIAQHINIKRSDLAYAAGLLHDIGKILFALTFPGKYNEILDVVSHEECHIIIAERKISDVDHTVIGKILCDLWKLPDEISYVLIHHHDEITTLDENNMLTGIISLGDYMCRKAQIGNPGDATVTNPSQTVFDILGDSHSARTENYDTVFAELLASKPEIENFFNKLG